MWTSIIQKIDKFKVWKDEQRKKQMEKLEDDLQYYEVKEKLEKKKASIRVSKKKGRTKLKLDKAMGSNKPLFDWGTEPEKKGKKKENEPFGGGLF